VAIAHRQRERAGVLQREVDVVEAERARPPRGLGRPRGREDEIDDAERSRQRPTLRSRV
jgi:hypothetical protein